MEKHRKQDYSHGYSLQMRNVEMMASFVFHILLVVIYLQFTLQHICSKLDNIALNERVMSE
jgi:hypothetical protein